MATGRPRGSLVWNYFKYLEEDKSVCLIGVGDQSQCGHSIKGKFPTNLKGHLKNKHQAMFKELEEKEVRKNEEKAAKSRTKSKSTFTGSQKNLHEIIQGGKKYNTNSERHRSVTKQLAIFIGSTNVPISLVEKEEFKELVKVLDNRYEIPGRTKIGKEVNAVMKNLKKILCNYLQKARLVNICTDIWTKRGMSASFLGVTAHFFSTYDNKRHNITLAARRFPSPHTAFNVAELVQQILVEWEIPNDIIHRVLTDNGSNMVKAFKEQVAAEKESEEEDGEGPSSSRGSQSLDSFHSGDEAESNDEELPDESDTTQQDLNNFEECEDDHSIAFVGFKRTSCFAHTLQLVVRVFDSFKSQKAVMRRFHKLVAKVNKSTKATEKLISRAGKKLIADCPTRWSSTYLMISRLLLLKTELSSVLEELQWDNLPISHWKQIESMVELLKPFAQYTQLTSSEDTTSISMVIPVVLELRLHLEKMKSVHGLCQVVTTMLGELERRFENIINPTTADFDPLDVMCTFLSPGYREILSDEQVAAARSHLIKLLNP